MDPQRRFEMADKELTPGEKEKKAEEEYNQVFDELDKAAAQPEAKDPNPMDGGEKVPNPITPEKPEAGDEDPIEPLRKALKDTQSYATKLRQENIELERMVNEFKKGNATAAQVQAQQDKSDKANTDFLDLKKGIEDTGVFEDYPELKDPLNKIAGMVEEQGKKLRDFEAKSQSNTEEEKRKKAKEKWENDVKPEILKDHSDFDDLMKAEYPNFEAWAQGQPPAMRFAALQSDDPRDISHAITEFKKAKAAGVVADVRTEEEKRLNKTIIDAGSLKPSNKSPTRQTPKREDVDGIWSLSSEEFAKM